MSKLTLWLDHRMDVVGMDSRKDLSEHSGLSVRAIDELNDSGSLEGLNRSERRWLAAALRVSLRKLEALDEKEIDWIDDEHVYDMDAASRPAPWQECDPSYWVPKEIDPESLGKKA